MLPLNRNDSRPNAHRLWIGTWSLGGEGFGPVDLRESVKTLQFAFDKGITQFDTAGFYAHGKSETLLRMAFRRIRGEVFISTKGGLAWSGRKVIHNASPAALEATLFESMKRLKTDYIDLYSLHWPDPAVPLEDSIGALERLQEKGWIRFWGVCNLKANTLKALFKERKGVPHQVHFNPIHRQNDIITTGSALGCLNFVTSPLEQGLLGTSSSRFGLQYLGKKDVRRRNPLFHDRAVLQWVGRYHALCKERGLNPAVVALLWIFLQKGVHGVICGPKNRQQLQEILEVQNSSLLHSGSKIRCWDEMEDEIAAFLGRPLFSHLEKSIK